jgi:hypothetical protein
MVAEENISRLFGRVRVATSIAVLTYALKISQFIPRRIDCIRAAASFTC